MTLFTRITRLVLCLAIGALLGSGAAFVYAQAVPPPGAPSCEQQLDQAQRQIIQLRKANAQSDFQAASLQEALMDMQKKQAEVAHTPVPPKAAEKK
jgi:septal ring factor EnvC (AmiA/AmiB activator)